MKEACEHMRALVEYMDRENVWVWGEDDEGSVPDYYSCERCNLEGYSHDFLWPT
jgi:hypothetical protein